MAACRLDRAENSLEQVLRDNPSLSQADTAKAALGRIASGQHS